MVAARGEQAPRAAHEASQPAETTQSGKAGGTWIPALTGERRPLCRLRKTNALEVDFTFAPEFKETRGGLPDAFTMRNRLPGLVGVDVERSRPAGGDPERLCGHAPRSRRPYRPRSLRSTLFHDHRPDHARRQVQMAGGDDRRAGQLRWRGDGPIRPGLRECCCSGDYPTNGWKPVGSM